jgi:hypothetical protein
MPNSRRRSHDTTGEAGDRVHRDSDPWPCGYLSR